MRYVFLRPNAYETWKRCPHVFGRKARLIQDPQVPVRTPPSRPLERFNLISDAVTESHRQAAPEPPDFHLLSEKLGSPWLCPEEREEMLAMLENYADIAAEWGGEYIDRDDLCLRRKSSKNIPVVLEDYPRLIFRHDDSVEARYLTTSRWEGVCEDDDLDFRMAVRHLVLAAAYPGSSTRISEVALAEAKTTVSRRLPNELDDAGAIATEVARTILGDHDFPPRKNHLCGDCEYAPGCSELPGPDDPAAENWVKITPSSLHNYDTCPRRYWLDSVLKLRGQEVYSEAASRGARIHSILHSAHLNGECSPESTWPEASDEDRPLLTTHAKICPAAFGAELVGAELDLYWMDRAAGVLLSGRLDTIWKTGSGIEVRDHKTGIRPATDPSDRFETAAYALLAASNYSPLIRVGFEYLATGEVNTVDADPVAAAEKVLSRGSRLRDATEFPATPGDHCHQCKFRLTCPHSEAS